MYLITELLRNMTICCSRISSLDLQLNLFNISDFKFPIDYLLICHDSNKFSTKGNFILLSCCFQ